MTGPDAASAFPASRIQSYTHKLKSHPGRGWWGFVQQRTIETDVNRQSTSLRSFRDGEFSSPS